MRVNGSASIQWAWHPGSEEEFFDSSVTSSGCVYYHSLMIWINVRLLKSLISTQERDRLTSREQYSAFVCCTVYCLAFKFIIVQQEALKYCSSRRAPCFRVLKINPFIPSMEMISDSQDLRINERSDSAKNPRCLRHNTLGRLSRPLVLLSWSALMIEILSLVVGILWYRNKQCQHIYEK